MCLVTNVRYATEIALLDEALADGDDTDWLEALSNDMVADNDHKRLMMPGLDPRFEGRSSCRERCSNDQFCRGYSYREVATTKSTMYLCALFTLTNASSFCTFGRKMNGIFSTGELNATARCPVPDRVKDLDISKMSEGCHIKFKDSRGTTNFFPINFITNSKKYP